MKVKLSNPAELDALMDAKAYEAGAYTRPLLGST
jgi:hypothetical protein